MRNIQMGSSSAVLALVCVFVTDGAAVREKGFFFGYNNIVICEILLQALGGLVVAVVVKYADNILKGFAASFSIITSCVISYFFLDFEPSLLFVTGAACVLVSSYIYEKGLPPKLSFLYVYIYIYIYASLYSYPPTLLPSNPPTLLPSLTSLLPYTTATRKHHGWTSQLVTAAETTRNTRTAPQLTTKGVV